MNTGFDFLSMGEMETRMTKEELALDILECLGQYYSIYYNFMEHQTNVRFRVVYKSDEGVETVYTNVPELSLDELRGFGKYLFIPGNTIRMDTNLAVIPRMQLLFWKHGIRIIMTRIIWWFRLIPHILMLTAIPKSLPSTAV